VGALHCALYSKPAIIGGKIIRCGNRRGANGNAVMAQGKPAIAFIGFGEAGQAIAAGLHDADAAEMTAWDILFPQAEGMSLRRATAPHPPPMQSSARKSSSLRSLPRRASMPPNRSSRT
jgi:hypothetical protein